MFSKDRANGEGSISAKEKVRRWENDIEDSVNLEENIDCFDEFSIPNVESYSPMVSPSYSCETSSKRQRKHLKWSKCLKNRWKYFNPELIMWQQV